MEKISIKDLINRYRNLEFYDIQDRVALVGLAILIVLGVYKGYSKDIKIRNLESNLKSVSDIIDSQDESLYTYADDTYNMHMRDELDYLRSREETYYKASNLKLIRYREDSPWRIAVPSVRVTISDLSVHDDVFKDTPCTKVIDGYAFEYIDLLAESVSVNGMPVAYINVLYAENSDVLYGENAEYKGIALLVDGELAYREVSFYGNVTPEYSFRDENIQIKNLSDLIDVNEDDEFNINELQVMVDSINHSNALRLEVKEIN